MNLDSMTPFALIVMIIEKLVSMPSKFNQKIEAARYFRARRVERYQGNIQHFIRNTCDSSSMLK